MSGPDRAVIFALSLGTAVVVLDATALSVAIPAIGRTFDSSLAGLQWVSNSYVVAFAAFILTTGRFADRFGARTTLVIGTCLFSTFSLCCALAPNVGLLVAARFLQGISGAVLMTASLALLGIVFPSGKARATAIASLSVCGAAGVSFGPLVGGVLVDGPGWQWIFGMNVVIGALIVLSLWKVQDPARHGSLSLDVPGQITSVLALGGLATALIQGGEYGWTDPVVIVASVVFGIAGVLFLIAERRQSDPMLPLSLFANHGFAAGSFVCGIRRFAGYGLIFLLSIYLQDTMGYSSAEAGLAFLPLGLSGFVGNTASTRLVSRFGSRHIATLGFAISSLSGLALFAAPDQPSYWWLALAFVLFGIGDGIGAPALLNGSLTGIRKQSVGVASGVFNAGGQTGSLIGVALIGGLADAEGTAGLHSGGVLICLSLLVATALVTRFLHSTQSTVDDPAAVVAAEV